MEKNAYICMIKNCSHMSALLSDMEDIEKHPGHIIVNIKTLKEQLSDLQSPLYKLQSINRGMVMSDVEKKIQELTDLSKALITDFGQKMRKFANDTMNIYDDNLFLINAVNNQDIQIIGDNSRQISLLFNLDLKETEEKLEEAVNMRSIFNETTDSLKIYLKELYQSINFGPNQFEIQKHQWSQSLRNKNIEIKEQNAKYGEHDGRGHVILLEPRIDFNSIQSCKLKFNGGNSKWIGAIRLVDYKILQQKDPDFKDDSYGQYEISYDGRVTYDNKQLPIESIKFKKNDIIEVNWDGPRRIFGIRIKKIGSEAKFEMKVNITENSELYFGVALWKFNCSIE